MLVIKFEANILSEFTTNGSGFGERGNMEKDYTTSDGWSWHE